MRVQGRHAVQVAVLLSEIKPVTNHEFGVDIPAHVFDLYVGLHRLRLAQQGADFNGCGAAGHQVLLQPRQRQPGINNVFNNQHVPTGQIGIKVFEDTNHT